MDINQFNSILSNGGQNPTNSSAETEYGNKYPYDVPVEHKLARERRKKLEESCLKTCKECLTKESHPQRDVCLNQYNFGGDTPIRWYETNSERDCARRCVTRLLIEGAGGASTSDDPVQNLLAVTACTTEAAAVQEYKQEYLDCKNACAALPTPRQRIECHKANCDSLMENWIQALENFSECIKRRVQGDTPIDTPPGGPIIVTLTLPPPSKPTDEEISYTEPPIIVDNWWNDIESGPCWLLWKLFYAFKRMWVSLGCTPSSSSPACILIRNFMLWTADQITDCIEDSYNQEGTNRRVEFAPPPRNDPSVPGAWGSNTMSPLLTAARFLNDTQEASMPTTAEFAVPPPITPRMPSPTGCGGGKPTPHPSPGDNLCCVNRVLFWLENHPLQKKIDQCAQKIVKLGECKEGCKGLIFEPLIKGCQDDCDTSYNNQKPFPWECTIYVKQYGELYERIRKYIQDCDNLFGPGAGGAGDGTVQVKPPVNPIVKYPMKFHQQYSDPNSNWAEREK